MKGNEVYGSILTSFFNRTFCKLVMQLENGTNDK